MAAKASKKRKAPIWAYAKALGKPLMRVAPDGIEIGFAGKERQNAITLSCTITTQQEADAVCEIIQSLAGPWLSSHREMIRGDVYSAPVPTPSYADDIARFLGVEQEQGK